MVHAGIGGVDAQVNLVGEYFCLAMCFEVGDKEVVGHGVYFERQYMENQGCDEAGRAYSFLYDTRECKDRWYEMWTDSVQVSIRISDSESVTGIYDN